MKFIAREHELNELEKQYKSYKYELAVIYGRRRVGKTTLIQEFLKGKDNTGYFIGIESSLSLNLEMLSMAIYRAVGLSESLPSFQTLTQAFIYLFEEAIDKRIVFVIDEFPYLANAASSVSSELQAVIDKYRDKSKLMLILCGSSMSFMENQVLGYKSPLYGRRTSQFKIHPFNYLESRKILSEFNDEEASILHAITGGIAEYLSFINPDISMKENVINLFLSPSGRLFEEPSNLLQQELREPRVYNDILTAVAQGANRNNEIAMKTKQSTGSLSHYLKSLTELGIIEKRTPVGEKEGRKSIYVIIDGMFRFWHQLVRPNVQAIELRQGELVYDERISPGLSHFMGFAFEQMAKEYLEIMIQLGKSPFYIQEYGQWWGNNPLEKRQEEFDLIALGDDKIIFAESKWSNQEVDNRVLNSLLEKSKFFKEKEKYYILFSKSDFKETLKEENIHLISLEDMYKI